MSKYMDNPLVRDAADRLKAALEAVAGGEVKNLLIVSLIPDQPGQGTAQASIFYKGCTCSECGETVLTATSSPFGALVERVDVLPGTVTAAREVH